MDSPFHSTFDAIAANVTTERRPLPCALLRACLSTAVLPRCGRLNSDRVLLLAAVEHAFLAAVREDWYGSDAPQAKRCWPSARLVRPQLIPAHRFQFAPASRMPVLRPPLRTHGFLACLAPDLVSKLLRWAPPVVSISPPTGDHVAVIENVIPAFLARRVIPARSVWVRVLRAPVLPELSALQLANAALPILESVVERYRDRIVVAAPTAALAERLTGLRRAMVFRIRQRAKAPKE